MPSNYDFKWKTSAEPLPHAEVNRLESALASWMPAQRWFRSKSRRLARVSIQDSLQAGTGDIHFFLLFVHVFFTEGEEETYFVPLCDSRDRGVRDAFEEDTFRRWFASILEKKSELKTCSGILLCRVSRETHLGSDEEVRLLRVEQSNSSLVVGSRRFVKIYRRVEKNINPEVEMLAYLERAGYAHVPAFQADVTYRDASGSTGSLALATRFVAAEEDGWKYVLGRLKAFFSVSPETRSRPEILLEDLRMMGQRTGELHAALSLGGDPSFRTDPVSGEEAEAWQTEYLELLRRSFGALETSLESMKPEDASRAAVLLKNRERMTQMEGYRTLAAKGIHGIRIHGDFHLGQILRPLGSKDWILFDFEGEPLRPLKERLLPRTAFRDIAGMLRSLSYAVSVASSETAGSVADEALEESLREAFLAGYFRAARRNSAARFLASSEDEDRAILPFFELEKAVYELLYELENRPDWVFVPLEGILRIPGLSEHPPAAL